jgi:peptide/nickel transport system permease protein/dipeptide transport system permease protein
MAGPMASTATVEAIRAQLGLDDPVAVQYARFLSRLVHGDLGTSVRTRQPVAQDVLEYAMPSLELILMSTFLGLILACLLALMQRAFGRIGAVRVAIVAAGSTPIFLSALLLVYFFWFRLDWLPGTGRLSIPHFSGPTGFDLIDGILVGSPAISLDAFLHIVLPAFALALPIAVAVGRTLSSSLHDVMRQSYIRTARGKGLNETRVVLRHGLRNAASAPLAMTALQVRLIFANLLIVEQVFARPGLGLYTVQAFASADLPAVLGVAMVFGTFYILVSILIEIGQSLSDPRILL